jgi:alpha-acetolactate decarboxylase
LVQNKKHLESAIIPKINGNLTVLEVMCYISSFDPNIERIKIENKEAFENIVKFEVTKIVEMKHKMQNYISKSMI